MSAMAMQMDVRIPDGVDEGQPAPAPRTRMRLTRRGRAVLGALASAAVAGLLLAAASVLGGPGAAAADEASGESFPYVIVQPGASLWNVAEQLDPAADPRDLTAEIVQLNQLQGSGVDAGQPIAVPLRYADSPVVLDAEELGIS